MQRIHSYKSVKLHAEGSYMHAVYALQHATFHTPLILTDASSIVPIVHQDFGWIFFYLKNKYQKLYPSAIPSMLKVGALRRRRISQGRLEECDNLYHEDNLD